MTARRAHAVFLLLLLSCAASFSIQVAAQSFSSSLPQAIPATRNPYNARYAALSAELKGANAPETAVLLARIYALRELVDDPSQITQCLETVASAPQAHPLVRDEALRYLALIDLHTNHLAAAEEKLATLGEVREWSLAGPFSSLPEKEAGLDASHDLSDAGEQPRKWHRLPSFGPQEWMDLSKLYPHSAPSTILAATSVYSAEARTVALRFAAESALTVFVNGVEIFEAKGEDGALGFDQHAAGIRLQAGWNRVLLRLTHSAEGPWRFGLRITALEGGGLRLRASASPQAEAAMCHPAAAECVGDRTSAAPQDLVELAAAIAESDPNSAGALETLGRVEQQHAHGGQLEHLETAARKAPTADGWLAVADECGDATCIFHALNAALHSDPENEPAHLALANYYFGRNQLEKARDLLREAVRLEPGDFVAREGLLGLYTSVGLNTRTWQETQILDREFPGPIWLKRKLAGHYLDLGFLDRAQNLVTAALAENFDGERERVLLAQIARRQNDAATLRVNCRERTEVNPADPAPWADWAELATGAGDKATAQRAIQTALELAPSDAGLREKAASLLARWGREDEARQELAKAIELNPSNEAARARLQLISTGTQADPEADYLADPAQLAAAARQDPPDQGGNVVALANIRVEHVYANGLNAIRQQQIFYIETEQGARDYSTRSVQYAPDSQDLRVLHARVYKRDGRVLEAEDSGDSGVAEANVSMYYDVRAHALRFPAVERGDVLELDYRITPTVRVNPYGDYYGGLVVFRTSVPQQLQRYVVITPAQRHFSVVAPRMTPAAVSVQGKERIYRWEARDIAPSPDEPRGPAITDVAPFVHVSTFGSWAELGRWYAHLIQPQLTLDASLREAGMRLAKSTHSEAERINAIYQFVLHNTHYVALEFGIYSYKPYPVTKTYARRFGDCKDKASLMIALLRQAGIEADIALVRTRRLGEVDPRAISVALFNHAIVYVPKYDLWLDGTAEYAGSHELPLEDQGANALTVAADGRAELRRIPLTQLNDNYTRRTLRAQVFSDGRIEFSGVFYTRGEDAPGLRRDYESPEHQRDAVHDSLAEVFPSVHVDDVQVNGANDLEHPVTVEFRGELDAFNGRTTVPLASSWSPRSYLQTLAASATRTQDLLLPAPWIAEEELHFQLPAGAVLASVPADTVIETAFGSAILHYRSTGRELVVNTSVQFRKLRITPAEYTAFRDFCQQVEQAFHREAKVRLRG